jgi:hypothetical protein
MLLATRTCSDAAIAYGPWLWGMPASAFVTTSNTARADYNAPCEKWLRFEQIFGLEQATSNTAPDVQQASRAHTNAGPTILVRVMSGSADLSGGFHAREAIHELRRLSGLTWEDMADLLSVTRRSLHLWANGGAINTPNEKHVRDLLMALRTLDRGTARENRSLLLAPRAEGGVFADLLRDQRFEDAIALGGHGRGRAVSVVGDVSPTVPRPAKLSVAEMLGTSAARVHTDEGRALPSRRRRPRV